MNDREQNRTKLAELAQEITSRVTWDDLVLDEKSIKSLHEVASCAEYQLKNRNRLSQKKVQNTKGVTALFTGQSRTGKTMAAKVLANQLRLSLFRINLSTVVSNYIGETEKNLSKVFDAAENGGVILFFDEADALFGKRSEVNDSHDQYANVEISYLLQRMESYRGLAILATNMKKSDLDQAFIRRLRFIVNFPFPD